MSGSSGADTVSGGSGSDRVSGGPGADKVSGGSGNDLLFVRDGSRDTVSCGAGDDGVSADRSDVVASDCESIPIAAMFTLSIGEPPRVMMPVISTPGSSFTSSGFVDALTCVPRSDAGA